MGKGKGQGSPRRAAAVKIGALVAVLVLTLLVPSVAFAANTATFGGRSPAPGAFTSDSTPRLTVVVYDRFGISGSSNVRFYVDGVRKTTTFTRFSGTGLKKIRMACQITTPLADGSHSVKAWVRDRAGRISATTWTIKVDTKGPVTTAVPNTLPMYQNHDILIQLSATDAGSGVASTFFVFDGGAPVQGTLFLRPVVSFGVLPLGPHTFEAWSVDKLGNIGPHLVITTTVIDRHALPSVLSASGSCIAVGCHFQANNDISLIHSGLPSQGCLIACHGSGITPSNNCAACHVGSNAPQNHVVHLPIVSSATPGSGKYCLDCHTSGLMGIHRTCAACHNPANTTTGPGALAGAVIAAGIGPNPTLAHCESCHGDFDSTHTGANPSHQVAGSCFVALCHGGDVTRMHTTDFRGDGSTPPGCVACHNANNNPAVTGVECTKCHTGFALKHDPTTAHAAVTIDLLANSAACTSCHSSDLTTVMLVNPTASSPVPTSTTGQDEHENCSCHYFAIAGPVEGTAGGHAACQNCHKDAHAPHGFDMGVSGHNTTIFGEVGAFSKWDGSEGVVVKDSEENTITQEWPLPTASVFWSQSKALNLDGTVNTSGVFSLNPTDSPTVAMANRGGTDMANKINKTVGWGSVITCQDCHTQLTGALGPQGANVPNFGLDPNFPDDWTRAEITSFDPTGMRSIETTSGSPNPYYAKLGSKVWPPEGTIGTTVAINVYKNGTILPTATVAEGAFYDTTSTPSNGYSPGVVTGRYICQKCHKLTNSYQGLGIEGNGRGFRDNNFAYMGMSNEAHMEHHNDMVTGQGNCVSCHIAIPHGWKRPRLLVYESDPAPYKTQWYFPNYSTDTTGTRAVNADLSQGNWGFLGWNGVATKPGTSSMYKLVGAAIPNGSIGTTSGGVWSSPNEIDNGPNGTVVNNAGKTYASHLEKIAATNTAVKELAVGPGDNDNDGDDQIFANNDVFNGTSWGKWVQVAYGVEWLPDTNPNALYSSEAIQNNCNGCTSAGLTHSDTGGTAEGVAETTVPGRTQVGGLGTWSRIPFWK